MKISRRDFIHVGCALAAATFIADPVKAWVHGSQPLRFVTPNIAGPTSTQSVAVQSATTTRYLCRMYFSIGSGDVSQIVLSFFSFYIQDAVGVTGINGFKIESAAIEMNSTSAPVTFSGGRSLTVAANSSDVQSDPFFPASVGLSKFAQGSTGYLRLMLTFSNPSTDVATNNGFSSSALSAFSYRYDPTKVSVTNGVDGTGAITYSMINGGVDGTDIVSISFPYTPAILGKFVSGDPGTWVIIGDSAAFGTGGNLSAEGARGLSRAFYPNPASPSPSGAIANWNLGCNSGAARDWAAGTPSLINAYLKYFKYAIDEYGGNDMNIPASQAIWTTLRASGIRYIIKTSLIPRTTSTDNWATEPNQTISTNWGPGSSADTFEQGLKALVASDLAYIQHMAMRESDNYWLWLTNGTTFYATADGEHPSDQGYVFKATGTSNVTTPGGTVSQTLQQLIDSLP